MFKTHVLPTGTVVVYRADFFRLAKDWQQVFSVQMMHNELTWGSSEALREATLSDRALGSGRLTAEHCQTLNLKSSSGTS